MSQAASQWAAFAKDVAKNLKVYDIRDEGGFPAPMTLEGKRAMPFWSTLSRANKIIANVPAYQGFRPVEIEWETFRDKWLTDLEKDGLLVGVNWSGPRAVGYDMTPQEVVQRVKYEIEQLNHKN